MITIFHGINTPTSRKAFTDAKEKSQNPVSVDGAKVTLADLAQVLSGEALFAEEKYLFLDEFFSKRKASKETDALVDFILEHEKGNNIIIWESKELTTKQANTFKHAVIQKFDLPKQIFAFLDSILPKNKKVAIELFHRTLETEDPEFIYFMLVRHTRILLSLANEPSTRFAKASARRAGSGSNYSLSERSQIPDGSWRSESKGEGQHIDEVKRMAPWQKTKLTKQANQFSLEFLLRFYNSLFTIEAGLKTGNLATSLIQAIDFLLITL